MSAIELHEVGRIVKEIEEGKNTIGDGGEEEEKEREGKKEVYKDRIPLNFFCG